MQLAVCPDVAWKVSVLKREWEIMGAFAGFPLVSLGVPFSVLLDWNPADLQLDSQYGRGTIETFGCLSFLTLTAEVTVPPAPLIAESSSPANSVALTVPLDGLKREEKKQNFLDAE